MGLTVIPYLVYFLDLVIHEIRVKCYQVNYQEYSFVSNPPVIEEFSWSFL